MEKFETIKGFAFDLDGVIANTAKFHDIAWKKIAEKVGAPWSDSLGESLKGIDRMGSLDLILDAGGLQEKYDVSEKEKLTDEKNKFYLELVDQLKPDETLPGVRNFLESLKENGYKISLASASKNAPTVLGKLELTKFFDAIVDPTSVSAGKPDPAIYTAAALAIDLDTSAVIGVEDASAGIQAINSANEISIGIGDAKELSQADILFADTSQLTLENISSQFG